LTTLRNEARLCGSTLKWHAHHSHTIVDVTMFAVGGYILFG
jgi:hypothetical protein